MHDRPAGGGVDGGELVHLADAFEVADVEAVQGDEIAGPGGPVAEPERLVVAAGSVTRPVVGGGDRGGSGDPLGAAAEAVVDEDLLHRRLGDHVAPLSRAGRRTGGSPSVGSTTARVSSSSTTWVGVALGSCGAPPVLGHQRLEAVALGDAAPLVERRAGDAEGPARLPPRCRSRRHDPAPGHGAGR